MPLSLLEPLRPRATRTAQRPESANGRARLDIAYLLGSVSRQAGGMFECIRRLAEAESLHDTDVQVLGVADQHTARDLSAWGQVPTRAYRCLGPRQFGYSRALNRALSELDVDLVHTHGLWMYPSVAALRWHRRTRRPYIVHPHGMLDRWAVRNSAWKKRLAGWLYENAHLRQAACLRALCRSEAESIRAHGLRNPICVIPNGIDLPQSVPDAPAPWGGRVDATRKVLLFLGRLHPKKGLPGLLRAWADVRRRRSAPAADWVLAIAGWDQQHHEARLRWLTTELGVDAHVHFLGPQFGAEKAAALHQARAFVLPSFSEGLPMSVLEAWAYRLPALITPECNLPEGFAAGAAIPIETSPPAIARGLETLFAMSEDERRAMGARGRQLVAERFAWPGIATNLRSVCDWLLHGAPRPACVDLGQS